MQGLRHVERLDRTDRTVRASLGHDETTVEEHPDGLDGVQRHAFGATEDAGDQIFGKTRHQSM